jgi:hypothetical protein
MNKTRTWPVVLSCIMTCATARAATLQLLPQAALVGATGSTVGWGFTITNTTSGQWIEITSANFCTGSSGTATACALPSLGTFTDFISGYNDIVVGASPDLTTVTQTFSASTYTGIGSFQIIASNGSATGQIVLTYDVFSRSPDDPSFDPDTDTVSTDNFLTANATVGVGTPPATPAPASLVLMLISVLALGAWHVRRRFALSRISKFNCVRSR